MIVDPILKSCLSLDFSYTLVRYVSCPIIVFISN